MYKYTITIEVNGIGKEISIGMPVYVPSEHVILSGDDCIKGYMVQDAEGKTLDLLDFRVGVGSAM